jgi:transcriptional repressor NrdR
MRCPRCGHLEDQVIDSRPSRAGDEIRRRRECMSCAFRFTTYERVELQLPVVVKRDGRREPFSREKILGGLRSACQKRSITSDALERIVDRIESDLATSGTTEMPSRTIGDWVMNALRSLDEVAYLRFASVYLSFESLGEFVSEAARVQRTDE